MSALLRAHGKDFDVDEFIKNSNLTIHKISRAGSPARPTIDPNGRKLKRSGLTVIVSNADFETFELQLKESFYFIRDNIDELRRLAQFPGVQSFVIDFGANIYPPGYSSFRFPYPLLCMAGEVKVDLELSVYPAEADEDSKQEAQYDKDIKALDEAYEEYMAQKN